MNTVNLTGRLTRDPELVETKAGTKIATFRIAIACRERNGAVFCDVKTFGEQATACAEHLAKGRQIAVAGRLELASGPPTAARTATASTSSASASSSSQDEGHGREGVLAPTDKCVHQYPGRAVR